MSWLNADTVVDYDNSLILLTMCSFVFFAELSYGECGGAFLKLVLIDDDRWCTNNNGLVPLLS